MNTKCVSYEKDKVCVRVGTNSAQTNTISFLDRLLLLTRPRLKKYRVQTNGGEKRQERH